MNDKINIVPYVSVAGVRFGASPEQAKQKLGLPAVERVTRGGEFVMQYPNNILRFDKKSRVLRECTVPFGADVHLDGEKVDWTVDGLLGLCRRDGSPLEYYGSVVLFSLGVALTGVEDGAECDRSITAFCRGVWDDLREQMSSFET